MKTARAIRIFGKVQNVGFRYYTVKTAQKYDITGFVKNETDGTVYIEAEGIASDLETFTDWCRRGPQWAAVNRMEIQDIPVAGHVIFAVR